MLRMDSGVKYFVDSLRNRDKDIRLSRYYQPKQIRKAAVLTISYVSVVDIIFTVFYTI